MIKKIFTCLLIMSSLFSATPMDAEENKNSKEASKKLAIKYQGSKRFYVTPSGREILDKRKVGPIYPNLFDVIRDGRYISTEDEDKGCNLEKMFLGTLYQKQGFAVRKYLNAIATSASNCSSLATPEERNLCQQFHSNPSCRGVKPIVFEVEPLTAGQSYLTLKKQTPFSCASKVQVILNDTYISKQSEEWSKIERDLIEKKREKYVTELKAKAPINKIRKAALVKNPSATQREIAFAVNDWVYSESKKASFNVPDSEIQSIVEKRYTPSSAMKNLISYGKTIGGSCAGKEKRYNSKVYAEASNIPAHEVLVFADYVDTSNKCICK